MEQHLEAEARQSHSQRAWHTIATCRNPAGQRMAAHTKHGCPEHTSAVIHSIILLKLVLLRYSAAPSGKVDVSMVYEQDGTRAVLDERQAQRQRARHSLGKWRHDRISSRSWVRCQICPNSQFMAKPTSHHHPTTSPWAMAPSVIRQHPLSSPAVMAWAPRFRVAVAGCAAAAASFASPWQLAVAEPSHRRPFRVVVIGAGIGGASTAYFLRQEVNKRLAEVGGATSQGLEIRVIDRRPQVGGRIRPIELGESCLEAGASIAVADNKYLAQFAEEAGLDTGSPVTGRLAIWDGDAGFPFEQGTWGVYNTFAILWRYGLSLMRVSSHVASAVKSFSKVRHQGGVTWSCVKLCSTPLPGLRHCVVRFMTCKMPAKRFERHSRYSTHKLLPARVDVAFIAYQPVWMCNTAVGGARVVRGNPTNAAAVLCTA